MGLYLPLSSDGIVISESSIEFDFSKFPAGKYILGISGVSNRLLSRNNKQRKGNDI